MLLFDTSFLFLIKSLLTFGLPLDLPDLTLSSTFLRYELVHVSSLHYIVDLQHVHVLLKDSGAIKPDERCPVSLEVIPLDILNKRLDLVLVEFFQSLCNHGILIILQLLRLFIMSIVDFVQRNEEEKIHTLEQLHTPSSCALKYRQKSHQVSNCITVNSFHQTQTTSAQ